jgi:hypothetical protein
VARQYGQGSLSNGENGQLATRVENDAMKANQDSLRVVVGVFRGGEHDETSFEFVDIVDLEIWHLVAGAHNLLKMAGSDLRDSGNQVDS